MGQYHYICNMDRKEFLHPHDFGDGLKLLEFGCSAEGTLTGLAILLACSNGRGGGDLRIDPDSKRHAELEAEIVGRWAGDRIAIIGDYHEPADLPGFTDDEVAETGGYSGYEDGKSKYDAPLVGDVPWNDGGARDNEEMPTDLDWINISNLVIEAMEMDGYVKQSRNEPMKNIHGAEIPGATRASAFGGKPEPTAKLNKDGSVTRIKPKKEKAA